MYARSTTIMAEPSSLERGIAFVRDELMSDLTTIDGCAGLSLLVDRESGRSIATTSWHSQEAMRMSEDRVRAMRERYIATFGGTDATVDEWEVVVMHRDHRAPQGARARATYLHGDPATADQSIDSFRAILPVLEGFSGFCSASLLMNRDSGRAVSTVIYDSDAALAQTREQANQLRTRTAGQTAAEILEVAEFELALAHLRVPKLV
ncbi:MAG TPA: hypothetical protein VF163_11235 [Micromonosporaceae bacterium]